MHSPGRKAPIAPSPHKLTPAMKTGLALMLQAHEAAADLSHDTRDFALEIHVLMKEAGLCHSELRSLLCQGYAEHLVERTPPQAKRRTFRKPHGLRLLPASCFVLSESCLGLARAELSEQQVLPTWDSDRRELRLGEVIVKRFRQPAKNQETILAAFQEDGWPSRIDNPLSSDGDTDAVDRLHDTVKRLNRHTKSVMRFLSDGTGSGVLWERTAPGAA